MKRLFDDLQEGLQEAIAYEKGKGKANITTYQISPVKKYSNSEIKRIRNKAGMTQTAFADYLGVSKKTVEAWELGRTHPTGPAFRLIDIINSDKLDTLDFISKK